MIRNSVRTAIPVLALLVVLSSSGCTMSRGRAAGKSIFSVVPASNFSIVPLGETTYDVRFEGRPRLSRDFSVKGLVLTSAALTLDRGGRFFRMRDVRIDRRYWSETTPGGSTPRTNWDPVAPGVADASDRTPHGSMDFGTYYDAQATVETFLVRPAGEDVYDAAGVIREITGRDPRA